MKVFWFGVGFCSLVVGVEILLLAWALTNKNTELAALFGGALTIALVGLALCVDSLRRVIALRRDGFTTRSSGS